MLGQLRLQPADDVGRVGVALVERLQVDQHAPVVERRVRLIDADERRQALDRRILADDVDGLLLQRRSSPGTTTVCGADRDALNDAGVLNRERSPSARSRTGTTVSTSVPAKTSSISV